MTAPARYFCTLFDSNYLLKGLALLHSLQQHCPDAVVFVLCLDAKTQRILENFSLPRVFCVPLSEVESPELLAVKPQRGVAEYCWTLSPCLPWHILQTHPEVDFITYLDADICFFSSLEPLFREIANHSIAIIEHRFSERLKDREINGRFCVEWVSFRRDPDGLACLSRWREQCIEWCFYRLEDGKMGDQKYLDEWPDRYASCHILQAVGAGIAPWNYSRYKFGTDRQGRLTVDDELLIFYHFHQFQLLANGTFDRLSSFYTEECREPEEVYLAYEAILKDLMREVRQTEPGFTDGLKSSGAVARRRWAQRFLPRPMKDFLHRLIRY
jgi:hypothetical protein